MVDRLDRLDRLLRSVNRNVHALVRAVVAEHGLPHASMPVMAQIHRTPGVTVSEMARRTRLAKSHISNTVETLASAGLLEKRGDPDDQRLVRIYPTEKADAHFHAVHAAVRAKLAEVGAALSSEQLDAVISSLQALENAVKDALTRQPISKAGDDHLCSGS